MVLPQWSPAMKTGETAATKHSTWVGTLHDVASAIGKTRSRCQESSFDCKIVGLTWVRVLWRLGAGKGALAMPSGPGDFPCFRMRRMKSLPVQVIFPIRRV